MGAGGFGPCLYRRLGYGVGVFILRRRRKRRAGLFLFGFCFYGVLFWGQILASRGCQILAPSGQILAPPPPSGQTLAPGGQILAPTLYPLLSRLHPLRYQWKIVPPIYEVISDVVFAFGIATVRVFPAPDYYEPVQFELVDRLLGLGVGNPCSVVDGFAVLIEDSVVKLFQGDPSAHPLKSMRLANDEGHGAELGRCK